MNEPLAYLPGACAEPALLPGETASPTGEETYGYEYDEPSGPTVDLLAILDRVEHPAVATRPVPQPEPLRRDPGGRLRRVWIALALAAAVLLAAGLFALPSQAGSWVPWEPDPHFNCHPHESPEARLKQDLLRAVAVSERVALEEAQPR